jgi:hypothetical protein
LCDFHRLEKTASQRQQQKSSINKVIGWQNSAEVAAIAAA